MHAVLRVSVLMMVAAASGSASSASGSQENDRGISFNEMFGINEAQARKVLNDSVFECLRRAHEDFDLALKGKAPRNAKSDGVFSDGGTTLWQDSCYTLVIYSQFSHICGVGGGLDGSIVGPELHFRQRQTKIKLAGISRTRFATSTPNGGGCAP